MSGESWHGAICGIRSGMPTKVKLDDKLITEAIRLGGFKTKQEAINAALAEFVERRNRLCMLELGGKIEFDPGWDYKRLRGRL